MAGFSCVLFTPCIPAVGVVADDVKFAIYAPGDDRTGLAGGTGGPCVGCEMGALISTLFRIVLADFDSVFFFLVFRCVDGSFLRNFNVLTIFSLTQFA